MANQESFFTPLSRIKISLFSQTGKKVEIVSNGKSKTIEANSNIISRLLVISSKLDRKIDMKSALSFPLCNTPMNLAHADGARRTTGKSAFTSILLNECLTEKSLYPQRCEVLSYMVDLMALIRARKSTPSTFKDLIIQIIEMIPMGYKRVDIIADTYRNYSIKDPERSSRGCTEKILVKSHSTQLPRNFDDFLKNGENKQRLIELFQVVLSNSREEILESLNCDMIFFSMDKICYEFSREGEFISDTFSSNQEEADTKLILHCYNILSSNPEGSVIIRSHSGDTDINIVGASLMIHEAQRVFIDFNTGAHRKVLCLGDLTLSDVEKKSLIGIHAFTGNDYVSSFFRKSKKMCWKVIKRNPRFFQTFAELGTSWIPSENVKKELEEYVCLLFETSRSRIKEINDMRYHLYKKKFEAKEKIIDLSLLPPCFQSLQLHILRSCYVARRYRLSTESNFVEPSIVDHGWKESGQIHWVDKAFPDDIEQLLVDENIEDEEYVESDDASESSDVEQE